MQPIQKTGVFRDFQLIISKFFRNFLKKLKIGQIFSEFFEDFRTKSKRARSGEKAKTIANGSSWAPPPTEYGGILKFVRRDRRSRNKREGRPLPYEHNCT